MKPPKISVVTISYNQGQFLEETIQSVLGQNYENLEYIIIDAGSTDNSIEIIKKYEDHLAYWCTEKDNGPASGLNKGFAKATGDYFYYLNSDDVLLPEVFHKVAKFIEDYPDQDVYYGHGYRTDGELDEKYKVYSDLWNLNRYRFILCTVIQQATFIKAEAFRGINGFNEKNRSQWDGELLVDLGLWGAKFKRFNFHTAIFRVHDQSSTGGAGDHQLYLKVREKLAHRIQQQKNYTTLPRGIMQLNKLMVDPMVMLQRIFIKLGINV